MMTKLTRMALPGLALGAFLALGVTGTAHALHDGGVAHCDACHTMHNSADNPASGTGPTGALLKAGDASSVCLNCHGPDTAGTSGSYHVMSTDGSGIEQSGDFFWMTQDYTVVVRGTPTPYDKDDHGHNVIAVDYGLAQDADPNNALAPGGSFPSIRLGCNSCHDPHGVKDGGTPAGVVVSGRGSHFPYVAPTDGSVLGNYRLLGSTNYIPYDGAVPFGTTAPIALANGFDAAQVDYGSGMSEWCGNCHGDYAAGAGDKHPAGNTENLNGEAINYNQYVQTGLFNGVQATAYDGLVPFERGETDPTLLNPASTMGPDSSDNVMCLTCHRAHASANANAGRWDFEVEYIAESHALEATEFQATWAVYYKDGAAVDVATEYGTHQRSLCNKCHVRD
jgi:hypothetical protein